MRNLLLFISLLLVVSTFSKSFRSKITPPKNGVRCFQDSKGKLCYKSSVRSLRTNLKRGE